MDFTNLEQSYILEKLGVDINTADCFMLWVGEQKNARLVELHVIPNGKTYKDIQEEYSSCRPAWSAYALMKLLPFSIDFWEEGTDGQRRKETCLLSIIPGDTIAYETVKMMKTLISRKIDKDVIGETILILSTVKKITKAL